MFIIKKKRSPFPTGAYISEIDKQLAEFDRHHAWSNRQTAERAKYKRIFNLRDHAVTPQKEKSIWDFER